MWRDRTMKSLFVSVACVFVLGTVATMPATGQARLWEEPGRCDRDCLNGMVDSCLDAIVAHDPDAAPLSSDIRYTQNTELLSVGEGLWETATASSATFRIYVPDPVARQVGLMGVLETGDSAVMLALRLKVENDEIVEAEHMVANVGENSLANLERPRPGLTGTLPPWDRVPRELPLIIGASYYDSIEQSDGSATLYAEECERHENGMITAGGTGLGRGGQPRAGCHDSDEQPDLHLHR